MIRRRNRPTIGKVGEYKGLGEVPYLKVPLMEHEY